MRTVFLCITALVMLAPASAQAATLTLDNGTLTYTASAGRVNSVTVGAALGAVTVVVGDNDLLSPHPGACAPVIGVPGDSGFSCPNVARVVVNAGDLNDSISATDSVTVPVTLNGEAGDDDLAGGSAGDILTGGEGQDRLTGGDGDDALDGGAGDDVLEGEGGGDVLTGAAGVDTVRYRAASATPRVTVTLDGVANDGVPGENDAVAPNVENVAVVGLRFGVPPLETVIVPEATTLTGDAGPNELTADDGDDTLVGAAGNDILTAYGGDDTIDTRDGFLDRVHCGTGTDSVTADTLDLVDADCETVSVANLGNASDDRPPAVAWSLPAASARLAANPRNTLEATAEDDRGIALVRFLDDDRVLCEDAAAPYTCAYRARGEDVGRNTLTVVAVDTGGQTASAQRAIVVRRFRPRLTLSVRGGYARGRVVRPSGLTSRCSGTVAAAGRKAKVTRSCRYRIKLPARHGKVTARYGGNAVMVAVRSR